MSKQNIITIVAILVHNNNIKSHVTHDRDGSIRDDHVIECVEKQGIDL